MKNILSPSDERDRVALVQWIEQEGISQAEFAKAVGVSEGVISKMLSGRRPISDNIRWRFFCRFGGDESRKVFGGPPKEARGSKTASRREPRPYPSYEKEQNPERYEAAKAVAQARRFGELPHPSVYKCHNCDKPAEHYHHPSYREDDRLCVVPLCRTCHIQHHKAGLEIEFGVVPTAVGLVRIAIAGDPSGIA